MVGLPEMSIDRTRQRRALDKLMLDLHSLVSQTCGCWERPASPGDHQVTLRFKSDWTGRSGACVCSSVLGYAKLIFRPISFICNNASAFPRASSTV